MPEQRTARSDHGRVFAPLLALALATRVFFIVSYPAVYGGDATARMARADELLLGYQLPLPQALVFLTRHMAPAPIWTRLFFAILGALVPVALFLAIRPSAGNRAAWIGAALVALHPALVYYSVVPYQESLTIALLLFGAAALQARHEGLAGLLISLACLCRYEAWIAVPFVLAPRLRKRPLRALALFAAAPLVWLLLWRGVSPAGTYVLDLDPLAPRWPRVLFLFSKLREYSGVAVLGLAAAGAAVALRARLARLGWGLAFLAAVGAAVVVAGHEFPPGSGQVSERLIHFPAVAGCALAGIALGALSRAPRSGHAGNLAAGLFLAWQAQAWLRQSDALIREANRDPSLELAFQVAQWAGRELGPGERLTVIAPPVPQAAIDDYVRKVKMAGGDEARAIQIAAGLARHSPDADRVAANLARRPGTVSQAIGASGLVAVFDDRPVERSLGPPLARWVAGPRSASVFRLAAP